MKRIIAFVKPNMLDDVIFGLHELDGFPGASVATVHWVASAPHEHAEHVDCTQFNPFPEAVRLEIVCETGLVDKLVACIQKKAHTGLPDDGHIYVSSVDEVACIRSGARDASAL